MKHSQEIRNAFIFTFLLLSCSNSIKIDDENLILNDIVGNEIVLTEKNKEEVHKILRQEDLLNDKDRWFYIDRNFYVEHEGILLDSTWVDSKRDNITILWFSKNKSQKKTFEEYIESKDIRYYNIAWHIAITYDEKNKKILLIENEF